MKLNELKLTNPYLELSDECYDKVAPTPLHKPFLIHANEDAAKILNIDLDELQSEDFVKLLNGEYKAEGSDTFAMCYAGHQFGAVENLRNTLGALVNTQKTTHAVPGAMVIIHPCQPQGRPCQGIKMLPADPFWKTDTTDRNHPLTAMKSPLAPLRFAPLGMKLMGKGKVEMGFGKSAATPLGALFDKVADIERTAAAPLEKESHA